MKRRERIISLSSSQSFISYQEPSLASKSIQPTDRLPILGSTAAEKEWRRVGYLSRHHCRAQRGRGSRLQSELQHSRSRLQERAAGEVSVSWGREEEVQENDVKMFSVLLTFLQKTQTLGHHQTNLWLLLQESGSPKRLKIDIFIEKNFIAVLFLT